MLPRNRAFLAMSPMLALLGLPACTGSTAGYPSLAPRPIEQLSLTEPSRPAPAPQVASPAATAHYAPLVTKARAADAAFRSTLGEERNTLAKGRGAAEGSEAWTAAQVALTRVEAARGDTAKLLADLDATRNAPATQTDTAEAVAASQAYDEVARIDQSEQVALAAVWPDAL